MADINSNTPFLSADFGEAGGRMEWATFADVQSWISNLQNSWSWLAQSWTPNSQAWNSVVSGLTNPLNQFQQAESYRTQGQETPFQNFRDEGKRNLETLLRSYPWLLPQSPQRDFVFDMKDSGKPGEAGLIAASWFGHDLNGAPIRSSVWAMIQLELFDRGIKDKVKIESAALKRLVGDLQTKLTEFQEEERKQVGRFNETHTGLETQSTAQQSTFDSAQGERESAWNTQLDGAKTELKQLQDTYDKYMSLAAPVKYWESKQKRHGRLMIGSGIVLVVAMVLSGWFLHTEIDSIGKAAAVRKAEPVLLSANAIAKAASAPSSAPSSAASSVGTAAAVSEAIEVAASWRLGSFILLATLCFWVLRLLVRVFLSNMHLENDASERVTMAKTYLALLRKGRLPEKEDISMVLAALFRPSGDGIVKDEGVPPTTLEWFTKLGK